MTELYLRELNHERMETLDAVLQPFGFRVVTVDENLPAGLVKPGDWASSDMVVCRYRPGWPIMIRTRHQGPLKRDPNWANIRTVVEYLSCQEVYGGCDKNLRDQI